MRLRIASIVMVTLGLFLVACSSQPASPSASQPAKSAEPAKPAESAKPAAVSAAKSDSAVASFYKGKTVTIVVGWSPGGGYDLYSRLLARHYGKYIPGNPTVIVQNMPGAGSMLAANHMYQAANKDGTVIGIYMPIMNVQQLTGQEGIQFDAAKFNWLGSIAQMDALCISRADTPVKKFEDLYTQTLKVGATGPGSNTMVYPAIMNALLGTKFEIINGYPGANDINLAIDRKEVDGACGAAWATIKSQRPDWIKDNSINLLVQTTLRSHPDLTKVPLATQFAKDDAARAVLEVALAPMLIGRPYVAPPGVPAERVEALRQAFMATMEDAQFKEEAAKSELDLGPVSGQEIQEMIERGAKTPKDQLDVLAKYFNQ